MSELKESEFNTPGAKFCIDDGILFVIYNPDVHVTLDIAKECIKARLKISKGKCYPLYADIRQLKSMEKGVRECLSKNDGEKLVSACAIIIGNELSRCIGNAFISINKPTIPVRLFTSEEKAIKWLQIYK